MTRSSDRSEHEAATRPRASRAKTHESNGMRLLVIDADPVRRDNLERTLSRRGHHPTVASTGFEGLRLAVLEPYDAVVLDAALPDVSGSDVLKMLRAVSEVAVIATMAPEESIAGKMSAGANDYLVEPYSAEQLEFRLRVIGRKTEQTVNRASTIAVGGLAIDESSRVAYFHDCELGLTRKEFDLLAYLVGKHDEVVTKRELAEKIWSDPYGGSDRTVDVHISWLRRKLGESAAHPRYIHTVRGVGVKLVDPQPES
jgi:two-component system, OmpR family, response regulator PrrA